MNLENAMRNMVRVGKVSSVDEENRTAKVVFLDKGTAFVSGDLMVLQHPPYIPAKDKPQQTEETEGGSGESAFESHCHQVIIMPWLPQVDDDVICLYFAHGEDGIILGRR